MTFHQELQEAISYLCKRQALHCRSARDVSPSEAQSISHPLPRHRPYSRIASLRKCIRVLGRVVLWHFECIVWIAPWCISDRYIVQVRSRSPSGLLPCSTRYSVALDRDAIPRVFRGDSDLVRAASWCTYDVVQRTESYFWAQSQAHAERIRRWDIQQIGQELHASLSLVNCLRQLPCL